MPVAWCSNPVLAAGAEVIPRHIFESKAYRQTRAKRYPAYVFSVRNGALMHRVREVLIDHYAYVGRAGAYVARLKAPAMVAHTMCGQSLLLLATHSRTCAVPVVGAVLCGRCHGTGPVFTQRGKQATKDGLSRAEAKVRLGCEVAGYPTSMGPNAG